MKLPLYFLLLLAGNTAHSQTHLLGIKGGFSATNANVELNNGSTPVHNNGFTAGIAYEQISESGFSFGADLLYSQRDSYTTGFGCA